MKKKTLILGLTSLFTLGAAGGVVLAFGGHLGNDFNVTADDTYSITITPQDLDNDAQEETDMIFNDANVTVKTDQNKKYSAKTIWVRCEIKIGWKDASVMC